VKKVTLNVTILTILFLTSPFALASSSFKSFNKSFKSRYIIDRTKKISKHIVEKKRKLTLSSPPGNFKSKSERFSNERKILGIIGKYQIVAVGKGKTVIIRRIR